MRHTLNYPIKLLSASIVIVVLSGQASAQQWPDNAQAENADLPSSAPQTKNWNYTIGGGVGYAAAYEGSDKYEFLVVPILDVEYKNGLFFGNTRNGIGSYPIQGEHYKLGGSIGYAPGRDESDDRKNLAGMGDLDASPTANLLAEYDLGPAQLSGALSTALSGDYGTTIDLNIGSSHNLTDTLILSGAIGTQWADQKHMRNHFGVSSAQSVQSAYNPYGAESGFKSVGFRVTATYNMTDQWNTSLTFMGDQLIGDAADSPLVKEDFVPAVFLTTSYSF